MIRRTSSSTWAIVLVAAIAAVGLAVGSATPAHASDHTDPPGEFGGLGSPMPGPADIADLYAWHTADDTIVAVLTFNGLKAQGTTTGGYADDVVYGIHLDTNDDQEADHDIWVRFGQNDDDEWGVQVQGIPGETEPVMGPVAEELSGANATVEAGVFDDPFFFDIAGFTDTTSNGSLTNDNDEFYFSATDSLAGTNANAVIVEFPQSDALDGETTVDVWATSSRMTGGN